MNETTQAAEKYGFSNIDKFLNQFENSGKGKKTSDLICRFLTVAMKQPAESKPIIYFENKLEAKFAEDFLLTLFANFRGVNLYKRDYAKNPKNQPFFPNGIKLTTKTPTIIIDCADCKGNFAESFFVIKTETNKFTKPEICSLICEIPNFCSYIMQGKPDFNLEDYY